MENPIKNTKLFSYSLISYGIFCCKITIKIISNNVYRLYNIESKNGLLALSLDPIVEIRCHHCIRATEWSPGVDLSLTEFYSFTVWNEFPLIVTGCSTCFACMGTWLRWRFWKMTKSWSSWRTLRQLNAVELTCICFHWMMLTRWKSSECQRFEMNIILVLRR